MEIISEQKYLIVSPRKLRPIVKIIHKLSPQKAILFLPLIKKSGSELVSKVIKSAISNASQKGINVNELIFKEIQIGEGPRLKRGQPVSRGRWHPIKKRMSHIRVVLTTNPKLEKLNTKQIPNTKQKTKSIKKIIRKGDKS